MLETLTHNEFQGRQGETFAAKTGDGQTFDLELLDVDVKGTEPEGHRTPFSVFFKTDEHIPQQTVGVEHEEMGSFDLFIVPLGPLPGGMRYEAAFG